MTPCVFYRRPGQNQYVLMAQTSGQPSSLSSYGDINEGMTGFLFAPFAISGATPLLLLRPDVIDHYELNGQEDISDNFFVERDVANERRRYGAAFRCFHDMLSHGTFSKIVLSRRSCESSIGPIDAKELFLRACLLYPDMFVALVSMPQCGTWLMATPEILVESCVRKWHTMALAGTMPATPEHDDEAMLKARRNACDISEWNAKNIQEQKYVSLYIADCLGNMAENIDESKPYTLRAGAVKHLATDFTFNLSQHCSLGDLISELHPTPAVCGIPKEQAYDFIIANEGYDRMYYSGFAGPLGGTDGTHLYVTLRCMQIDGCTCSLYAGGGLLCDSEEESEWRETENKMNTMRKCLAIKRI